MELEGRRAAKRRTGGNEVPAVLETTAAVCGFQEKKMLPFLLLRLLLLSPKVNALPWRHCSVSAPFITAADSKAAHLSG